jgi:hypothetical protein
MITNLFMYEIIDLNFFFIVQVNEENYGLQ